MKSVSVKFEKTKKTKKPHLIYSAGSKTFSKTPLTEDVQLSAGEQFGYHIVDLTPVRPAIELGHKLGHHLALIAGSPCPNLLHHLTGRLHNLLPAHLFRQILKENNKFRLLLSNEVMAISLRKFGDALSALLHFPGNNIDNTSIIQGGTFGDLRILNPSDHQSDRRSPRSIARF